MKSANHFIYLLLFVAVAQQFSCRPEAPKQTSDWQLSQKLSEINDIQIITEKGNEYYPQVYKLFIKQPIDHQDTSKGFFWQKVYLAHKSFDRPMTMIIEGYSSSYHYISEIADFTESNQIIVEHRYFGESKPDSLLWQYLNLQQAAADLHRIRQLLGNIYTKSWLASGISKGGQTTMAYQYFYPEDMDASVPYVAPLTFAREDPRIPEFIRTKPGSKADRQKITDFQLLLLQNKQKILPHFEKLAESKAWTFQNIGGTESGFEHGVLELSFVIWQWGTDVNKIPQHLQPIDSLMSFLSYTDPFSFFSDDESEKLQPYFYQALTEMGIYTYETEKFKPYLKYALNPNFEFTMQNKIPIPYTDKTNHAIAEWLKSKGNNIIYVYGNYDPWFAAGMTPDTLNTNAFSIILDGGSHRTRLHSFDEATQNRAKDSLAKWLQTDIKHIKH